MTDLNEWLLVWCHVSVFKTGVRGRGGGWRVGEGLEGGGGISTFLL